MELVLLVDLILFPSPPPPHPHCIACFLLKCHHSDSLHVHTCHGEEVFIYCFYTHACMHAHTHTHTHVDSTVFTHMHTRMHVHAHTCMRMYACTHMHMHTHTHTHTRNNNKETTHAHTTTTTKKHPALTGTAYACQTKLLGWGSTFLRISCNTETMAETLY